MEVLRAGTMGIGTRCFDLLCLGECAFKNDLKLDIQAADEIPNLITKNVNGDVVFKEPKPMCTIRSPRGHNVWANVELKTITTNASSYMCLGIKKQSEDEYYDILHMENLSRYVDVQEDDIVELIPLVSSTKLPTYTPVNAGDLAKITDETTYSFGSVYRVNITLNNERWLINQSCDLHRIWSKTGWHDDGAIGIGPVKGGDGKIYDNQLLIINLNGKFARSSDGIHWYEAGDLIQEDENVDAINGWYYHASYGNGIWCVISSTNGVRRSIDYGRTWSPTLVSINSPSLAFGNGIFMTITGNGVVYESSDAECWTQIGKTTSRDGRLLFYAGDRWIYGTVDGRTYCSKDGREWIHLSDGLSGVKSGDWYGACYAKGSFYTLRADGPVAKSSDGENWEHWLDLAQSYNITYYKNKLYMFNRDGTSFHVGLFNPDGTI